MGAPDKSAWRWDHGTDKPTNLSGVTTSWQAAPLGIGPHSATDRGDRRWRRRQAHQAARRRRPSIYWRFSDRRDLLEAMAEQMLREQFERTAAPRQRPGLANQALRQAAHPTTGDARLPGRRPHRRRGPSAANTHARAHPGVRTCRHGPRSDPSRDHRVYRSAPSMRSWKRSSRGYPQRCYSRLQWPYPFRRRRWDGLGWAKPASARATVPSPPAQAPACRTPASRKASGCSASWEMRCPSWP